MRVEAVGEIPEQAGRVAVVVGDGPAGLAVKSFVAAIESDDSLLRLVEPLAGATCDPSAGGAVCSGNIILEFRQAEFKSQRNLYFLLIEKLIELLKEAGSQETLDATLCLTSAGPAADPTGNRIKPNLREPVLWIRLAAKGVSPEQAVRRWGLGLTHVQQALLFTSRHLRLYLTRADG